MFRDRFIIEGFTVADYLTLTGHLLVWIALWSAIHHHVELAITALMPAMILDGLDGKIARALGVARPFGRYLGSFVDLLNYVVCPPLILYAMGYDTLFDRGVLFVYSTFGILRLSRFNEIGNIHDDDGKLAYLGLPAFWIHPVVILLYAISAVAGKEAFHVAVPIAVVTLGYCYLRKRPFWKPKSNLTIVGIPITAFLVFGWLTLTWRAW